MLKMKAANGDNVTSYAYNSLNQVTKMTDPMGYYETYSYDNSGNLISKVDKNGVTLKYTYDALGKVTREYAAVGGTEVTKASYQYNISGNLIKTENSNGKFEMFYNSDNRLYKMEIHQGSAYYRYHYNYFNDNNKRGLVSNKYLYRVKDQYGYDTELCAEYKYI